MNTKNQKLIVTLAIWLPTLLILFAGGFTGSADFNQTVAVLLPIFAIAGTVFLWTRKPPGSSDRE